MRYVALLLAALGLAACAAPVATLTPAQCDADWRAVGYNDGAEGAPRAKIDDYRAACGRGGAPLPSGEQAAWRAGWRDGVDEFCALPGFRLTDDEIARQDRLCGVAAAGDRPRRSGRLGRGEPRVTPTIGVGIGSGGRVRGGVGLGIGLGSFGLGF